MNPSTVVPPLGLPDDHEDTYSLLRVEGGLEEDQDVDFEAYWRLASDPSHL